MDRDKPLYLAGQTGTGKTAVALAIANRISTAEIINADAFQVYRGMEILTAAPTTGERASCPHHLFGILSAKEECDVASFAKLAKEATDDILSRGGFPLVVGGSGLYLKAITHGLAPTPKGDSKLRAELQELPLEDLVKHYQQLDQEGAENTNLQNRRYVTRNLEICILSGRPASEIKKEWQRNRPDIQAVFLNRKRDDIYERINRRTALMFEHGVLEEFRKLPPLSSTASKAIGIRELSEFHSGNIDLATCQEEIRKATRRYAKRQESWFRREPDFHSINLDNTSNAEVIAEQISTAV